jgi:uncharacterized protein
MIRRKGFLDNISITHLLIISNIFVFIVVLSLSSFNPSVFSFIALNPTTLINDFYLWTIISSMFMHASISHLFVNMLSLLFIGGFIEKIVGRKRFFSIYMISGIAGGLLFVVLSLLFGSSNLFGTGANVAAVGASGALFGIAGLMMILTPNLPVYMMFIPIPVKSKYAIPGLLVVIALISVFGGWPVGNSAHFGGLIAGIIYGLYLKNRYKNKVRAISLYFR